MAVIGGVPEEIYNTIFNLFRDIPSTLKRKKDANGYMSFEDIINEPVVYPLTKKYGGIQGLSQEIFKLGLLPRKNPYKFLELNPQRNRVRPVAHIFRVLRELEGPRGAEVWASLTHPPYAPLPKQLTANVEEFVPAAAAAKKEAENNAAVNAMFKEAKLNNIRPIWDRGNNSKRVIVNPENDFINEGNTTANFNQLMRNVNRNRSSRKVRKAHKRKSRKVA